MLYSSCSMNSVWIHVIERRDVNIKIRRLYTGETSRGMHSWSPFPGPKFNDVDSLLCTCSSQWRYRKYIKIMSPMVMATVILESIKNRHLIYHAKLSIFVEKKNIHFLYWLVDSYTHMTNLICVWLWTNIRLSRCFS